MSIIEDKKLQFEKAIDHLKNELDTIRTGRANPSLVEKIPVEYYGTKTPMQQLATISIPDAKSILIQPWDKNALKEIEKAIQNSQLGLNPVNEGTFLRLPIPPLTEDRRKELSKVANQKTEESRITIRNIREDIWRTIKDQKTKGEISEDDMYLQQKELQKIVDKYNTSAKELGEEKEKEIMTL
ncbi:MAG: ribosome recycling factor [Patescibacteria group bacterium]